MKRIFTTLLLLIGLSPILRAQEAPVQKLVPGKDTIMEYRRSSLYSVLIKHRDLPYGNEIDTAFMSMPVPDKFNDHNLDCRSFESTAKKAKMKGTQKEETNRKDIDNFVCQNQVPTQLIAKWFNRDTLTGAFNMGLIAERGYYDASKSKINIADNSLRGRQALADAGEDLIGKTFLLVNDITFADNGKRASNAAAITKGLGALAGALTGMSSVTDLGNSTAALIDMIDGFTMNITSYLYRLDWNEEASAIFYQEHWFANEEADSVKRAAFDCCNRFNVTYVGSTVTKATILSTKTASAKPKSEQMLKVCTRAVDKSIVELQREYEEFKVNVPISNINEDGTVEVPIGMKEGINEKSEFDVLIAVKDANNKTVYEKVGKIKPIKELIWDNRFGAMEEAEALKEMEDQKKAADMGEEAPGNVTLTATSFKIMSGGNKIFPGCLVRETTIKRD